MCSTNIVDYCSCHDSISPVAISVVNEGASEQRLYNEVSFIVRGNAMVAMLCMDVRCKKVQQ